MFLAGSILFVLSMVGFGLPVSETRFQVGETFPNLALPSLQDGRPTSLAQFRGKKVILHIFASW